MDVFMYGRGQKSAFVSGGRHVRELMLSRCSNSSSYDGRNVRVVVICQTVVKFRTVGDGNPVTIVAFVF